MAEALVVRGLCVKLAGRPVLQAIDFAVQHGELLAVLGPNGAGKSTLLRAIAGLLPYQGAVQLEGASAPGARERARTSSLVPQQSQLSAALSVREVVELGRYAHRAGWGTLSTRDRSAVDAALHDADVAALAERSYADLSSGEQKRVLIARALCTEARVLLLDEPTASLDIEHALRLFTLLRTLAERGRAIVLVLHQIEHALAHADRALLLQRGSQLACGPAREVLSVEHVRALYGVAMVPDAAPDFRLESP